MAALKELIEKKIKKLHKKTLLENKKAQIVKELNEDSYQDYLDTNYSSDGMEDHNAEEDNKERAINLYDAGNKINDIAKSLWDEYSGVSNELAIELKGYAESLRQKAIQTFSDWSDEELPKY